MCNAVSVCGGSSSSYVSGDGGRSGRSSHTSLSHSMIRFCVSASAGSSSSPSLPESRFSFPVFRRDRFNGGGCLLRATWSLKDREAPAAAAALAVAAAPRTGFDVDLISGRDVELPPGPVPTLRFVLLGCCDTFVVVTVISLFRCRCETDDVIVLDANPV